jgi:hypothetical protein
VGHAEEGLTVRGCGEWRTGTLTGYNNLSNDDNHTGSFNDYDHVTRDFLDHVNVVAIHEDDWGRGRYRNYELRVGSKTVRVQAWDLCSDRDDPACSRNKTKYAHPGYLFDMEARTARRLLGIGNAEDHLMQKVSFRVCDGFDPAPLARKYGLRRW